MALQPTRLELAAPNELRITWNDDVTQSLSVGALRDQCPCASCREKRKAPDQEEQLLPVLNVAETKPIEIVSMRPVGNYAYGIQFSDGHDTGIFTLDFLRRLGDEAT